MIAPRRHLRFQDLAKSLSLTSALKHKMGCVIVSKRKILSVGVNQDKTHTKAKNISLKLHAELTALLSLKSQAFGATAYVCRTGIYEELRLAKPCKYCEDQLKAFGIKIVYYSVLNGWESYKI